MDTIIYCWVNYLMILLVNFGFTITYGSRLGAQNEKLISIAALVALNCIFTPFSAIHT